MPGSTSRSTVTTEKKFSSNEPRTTSSAVPSTEPYQPRPALSTSTSISPKCAWLRHRVGALAVFGHPLFRSSGRRAVSTTRSPASSAASAYAIPNPPGVPPAMNQFRTFPPHYRRYRIDYNICSVAVRTSAQRTNPVGNGSAGSSR
ncbi:MAG: hypothetical protein QOI78_3729 [Actinomycetota bacterium]|nr:hypothetical protein [Actinomycetota bacterium]